MPGPLISFNYVYLNSHFLKHNVFHHRLTQLSFLDRITKAARFIVLIKSHLTQAKCVEFHHFWIRANKKVWAQPWAYMQTCNDRQNYLHMEGIQMP